MSITSEQRNALQEEAEAAGCAPNVIDEDAAYLGWLEERVVEEREAKAAIISEWSEQ